LRFCIPSRDQLNTIKAISVLTYLAVGKIVAGARFGSLGTRAPSPAMSAQREAAFGKNVTPDDGVCAHAPSKMLTSSARSNSLPLLFVRLCRIR
jgi:hypothetical protein